MESGWRGVLQGKPTSLVDDLLLDAQIQLAEKNTRSAMISAAVACEILLTRKVREALLIAGGIDGGGADQLADEVSKRALPKLLGVFYKITPTEIDDLISVFKVRNDLVHQGQHFPPANASVQSAIDLGKRLQSLEPRLASS